jgi:sugar phosphate isomerase/epimerase
MLRTGLNPYGLTYYLGLQGQGSARANPDSRGLEGFIQIALELGARTLEIHNAWVAGMTEDELRRLSQRLASLGLQPVISLGPPLECVDLAVRSAVGVGARVVRLGLTPVLCGARAECGPGWSDMLAHAAGTLAEWGSRAADLGLTLAIENHQDFGSEELLDFCHSARRGVGICLDTGNPLAVGEDPLAFARRVAPVVRHVHLKDYTPQWTDEGYRLVRCAIGDGAVPFAAIAEILAGYHSELTASLEPGALEARHICLLRPEWWDGYPPRTAGELAACLAAARRARLDEAADWRTPWERGEGSEVMIAYELDMIRRSAANMKAIGLM